MELPGVEKEVNTHERGSAPSETKLSGESLFVRQGRIPLLASRSTLETPLD
jgi:hypothetical protein